MTGFIVAGLVAAAILLGEYIWHDRLWFDPGAVGWWVGRLLVEAAAGAAAIGVTRGLTASNLVGDVDGLVTWVLAGIAAPRIVRGQLPIAGRNLNPLAHAYERLRGPFDEHIDEASGDAQREWVESRVEPAVRAGRLTPAEVGDAFKRTLHGRRLMTDADQLSAIQFVNEVLDDSVSDEEKVGTLVLRAQRLGTYRSMQKLVGSLPGR